MSLTIKQAFEKLAMVTGAAVKNPWFIGRNLNQAFAEIADNITDAGSTAEGVAYDNTDSGLTAENVQAAIDEVVDEMPKIKKATFSGTTSGTGSLKVSDEVLNIVNIYCDSYIVATRYVSDATYIHVSDTSGTTQVNINVSGYYYYFE